MTSLQKNARVAGFAYLLLAVLAPVNLMYVLPKLVVRGDAAATAANITASPYLLRVGIATELAGQATAVFVAWALYRLLKNVDPLQAALMVMLALVSTATTFANTLHEVAAMIALSGAEFLSVIPKPQLESLAYFFLRLHGAGINAVSIFWGLWLFPFGVLVYRSRFIPRIFGVLLVINGIAYLAASYIYFLAPQYRSAAQLMLIPEALGEPLIILWLLIRGARPEPQGATA